MVLALDIHERDEILEVLVDCPERSEIATACAATFCASARRAALV
jgi:hypothetical protein